MHKKLYTIALYLIGLTFVSPLIVLSSSYIFPFIVPKILFFRSVTVALIALFLILAMSSAKEFRIRLNSIHYIVLAFVLSFAISTFTGVDWYRSFWDNHERMLGLFTIVHYIAFFFVSSVLIRSKEDWQKVFRVVLGLGTPVMIIALIQVFNTDFLLNRGSRSASTLGNPIYVGGYGLFLLALGYLNYWKEKTKEWQWYSIITGLFGFLGMLASGTRGSMLGFVVGAFVMYAVYFFCVKKTKKIRNILVAIPVIGLVLLGGLFAFKETAVVQAIPGVNRIVTLNLNTRTLQTRTMAWNLAVEGAKQKALFGWGPNNYLYLFNEYYNPEFLRFGWQETWFDNAHNVVFNTLATQGWFGVITYFGIFIISAGVLISLFKNKHINIHMLSIGLGFLLMHFTHNFFVFENPTSYLYFMFFLAYIAWLKQQNLPVEKELTGTVKGVSRGVLVTVLGVGFLFIFLTNINPSRANKATLVLLQNIGRGAAINQVDAYEDVKRIKTPHIDDIRNDIARIFIQTVPKMIADGRQKEVAEFFPVIIEDLNINKKIHPRDIRVHIQIAEIYRTLSQYSPEQRDSLIQEAEQELKESLGISSNRQQLQFSLASIYLIQQRYNEAEELLKSAVENEPRVGESWWRYASVYKEQGNDERVKEILEEGSQQGAKWNENDKQIIEQYLQVDGIF